MAMWFVSRPTLLRTPPTVLFKADADELRHLVDPQSYSIDPAVHPSVARRHLGVQPASSPESAGRRHAHVRREPDAPGARTGPALNRGRARKSVGEGKSGSVR